METNTGLDGQVRDLIAATAARKITVTLSEGASARFLTLLLLRGEPIDELLEEVFRAGADCILEDTRMDFGWLDEREEGNVAEEIVRVLGSFEEPVPEKATRKRKR